MKWKWNYVWDFVAIDYEERLRITYVATPEEAAALIAMVEDGRK